MAPTMEKTLKYEMGIHGIEVKGVAFMKEGIFKYQLPHKPGAVQKDDTLANLCMIRRKVN